MSPETAAMSPSSEFIMLAVGLVAASVCTSLSRKDATARLNQEYPTGITSRWHPSKDKTFHTGEPNPHACPDYAGHTHYLFNC